MPRSRTVLSFMSQWGSNHHGRSSSSEPSSDRDISSIPASTSAPPPPQAQSHLDDEIHTEKVTGFDTTAADAAQPDMYSAKHAAPDHHARSTNSPSSRTPSRSRARADSRTARPPSMIQTYQPPQVDVAQDTPPELQPIFSYLNSHSNKLYQEGYFLKLHDLDSRGRPSQDRVWVECFAQLVGTVLSLWDAKALDMAGKDGEVIPSFINLSDASIRMIESLPMSGVEGGSLQNVLSVSTAANNRYLLHFNSLNSLTQWTAGIRLAMFEHSTLQEAYTGSLIAGKGKSLNNIRQIMERSKFVHEDWARVRFGAGTPWRRCWCVITPPDEKEYHKAVKNQQKLVKKGSAYGRAPLPKGDIRFYDTRKVTKRTRPIATISDAYAAYAIYPQSKPLVEQSTLVKLEGLVTIHSSPETTTEGFVFVMPEVHPAVSGFEMMLRWLFPVFDTFGLYGRPTRLIADVLDQRGLMFAMPQDRRYGYLDILDVSALIHTKGSQNWSERQWRKEMKKLTSARLTAIMENSPRNSQQLGPRRSTASRTSLPARGLRFDDGSGALSSPGSRTASPGRGLAPDRAPPRRTDTAPALPTSKSPHKRSASEAYAFRNGQNEHSSRLSYESTATFDEDHAPPPPTHGRPAGLPGIGRSNGPGSLARITSDDEVATFSSYDQTAVDGVIQAGHPPPAPVLSPPAFTHAPTDRPTTALNPHPDLLRAQSNVDEATLQQMHDAVRRPDSSDAMFENLGASDHAVDASTGGSAMPDRSRVRLSTIPGSPYVYDGSEFFQSPDAVINDAPGGVAYAPAAEAVSAHGVANERQPLVPRGSSHSVTRKPISRPLPQVPQETGAPQVGQPSQVREVEPPSPISPPSPIGSYVGAVIDQDDLERILNAEERTPSFLTEASSSDTPDYASTASASIHEPKKSAEKPRAGKLRTVGDPTLPITNLRSSGAGKMDTFYTDLAEQSAEIPTIDFGPTYSYKPTSRPGTGRTANEDLGLHGRSQSRDYLSTGLPQSSEGGSKRQSHVEEACANPTVTTPAPQQSRPWTPASPSSASVLHDRQRSLTPEQWVAHRAALAAQPHQPPVRLAVPTYAHHKSDSSGSINQLRQTSKTPPLSRTPPPFSRPASADHTPQHSPGRTPPSRPPSRGASTTLNTGIESSTLSSTLSAKEQMHLARATGSPLINLATSSDPPSRSSSPALVASLTAREREKAAVKEGLRSSAVQHAVDAARRAQAQHQAQLQAQYQARVHGRVASASTTTLQQGVMAMNNAAAANDPSRYHAQKLNFSPLHFPQQPQPQPQPQPGYPQGYPTYRPA